MVVIMASASLIRWELYAGVARYIYAHLGSSFLTYLQASPPILHKVCLHEHTVPCKKSCALRLTHTSNQIDSKRLLIKTSTNSFAHSLRATTEAQFFQRFDKDIAILFKS